MKSISINKLKVGDLLLHDYMGGKQLGIVIQEVSREQCCRVHWFGYNRILTYSGIIKIYGTEILRRNNEKMQKVSKRKRGEKLSSTS